MTAHTLETHSIAERLPLMPEDEFQKLKEDIEDRGLNDAIVMYEGKVLDGRHRVRAFKESGKEIPEDMIEYLEVNTEAEAIAFVISRNIMRRHLTIAQRAAVGANLVKAMEESSNGNGKQRTISIEKAAATVGVHPRRISEIEEISARDPEITKEIEAGNLSINKGRKQAEAASLAPQLLASSKKIAKVISQEFLEQIKTGGIKMSAMDQIEFSNLKPSEMKEMSILLEEGVTWREAQQYRGMTVTPETRLRQLHNLCLLAGGEFFDESNGFRTVVTKI